MMLRRRLILLISLALGACADLSVIKSDAPDPVLLGENITYSIQITNNGPDPAPGVVLTDNLSGTVSFISAVPTQGSCTEAGGVITCSMGDLADGSTAAVTVIVNTTAVGLISNSATVTSGVPDPNPANNTVTEDTTVDPAADLVLSKTDAPDPVVAGSNLTYSISVTNNGPSDATDVTLTDSLPALVSLVLATPSQGSCSESGGVVTCALGTVLSGESATVSTVVSVDPSATGTLTNTASITSLEADPDPSNNLVSEDTSINRIADLAIVLTDSPDPVLVGNDLTYTITITNSGPSTGSGVTVVDTLPIGVTFSSATSTQGSCSQLAGVVTCTIGLVTTSSIISVIINVNVDPATTGILLNTASVTANEFDPSTSNNFATATTSTVEPALPATGFAPGRATLQSLVSSEQLIKRQSDYWLEVPTLDLLLPIVGVPLDRNGWDISWLTSQVGYLEGTAFPTLEGNTLITAHNYLADGMPGPFVNLGELRWGDEILIHASGQSYFYQIRDVQVVSSDDLSHFSHEEYDWLTLLTCQGYDENTGTYLKRVVVRAVLIHSSNS